MQPAEAKVREFTEQLLRTGIMLMDILNLLIDELPEDAFPGEEPAEVLVDMLTGTLRPAADVAGERTVREATALLAAAGDRAMADLRAAAELAKRR